ncbi:adhesion G-protein coupled receptor V1 isoform X1 [Hydra vulgaris]|uniref:adhesion G-protein coupled receptor V1 isoform X1 n=1 Tax=Hydra vulgaris TaxID=6087 RepID=UPI001F5FD301|nr:adhesion G-protein coupled receptor V1 isoform X1 [Hydra vulgaris]XP_047139694.1 adhesion G-protein coupled receptor V1 isoform X1 [Hydra vulgaris]
MLIFVLQVVLQGVICTIQFRSQDYYVEEKNYNSVDVFVDSSKIQLDDIMFLCELSSNASSDFLILDAVGKIKASTSSGFCQFTIIDDDIPEASETFSVSLKLLHGNTTVQPKNVMITILPSDNPFGCIGFLTPANVITLSEPNDGNEKVYAKFLLKRYGGTIGEMVVTWKILQNTQDVYPTEGIINFIQEQSNETLVIEVLPDNIPEAEEIFSITIKSASEGGCILTNASEAELRIKENDAPIQFQSFQTYGFEGSILKVMVLRGLDLFGSRVGSISEYASVVYKTVPLSATPGSDYLDISGVLVFESGITRKEISIQIFSDLIPELKETFKVVLFNASNGILGNLTEIVVEIPENDDPYGLLVFDQSLVVIEEDQDAFVNVYINRTRGSFGNISVFWKINGTNLDSVFEETSGFLQFLSGEIFKKILIKVTKNNIPQEASLFTLELVNVTGEARFENSAFKPTVQIIVTDNDNAYGTFGFSSEETAVFLSTTPRSLSIKLIREGGTLADVAVYYSSYYFFKSSINMSSSAIVNPNGTVVFKFGQSAQFIVVEIKNDVFLSADSYFIVELDSIMISKSTLVPPSSPQLSIERSKRINITNNFANGEIGFYNIPVYIYVSEPSEGYIDVNLTLMRDGTASNTKVLWKISSPNPMLTKEDVESLNGSVIFKSGMDRVNLTIHILADNVPELDEEFTVELVELIGISDRLRGGANVAQVTIFQNDDPGGIISFSNVDPILLEENSFTEIEIIRTGGLLLLQQVFFEVVLGSMDFQQYKVIITFPVGISMKKQLLIPKDDDLPELNETFTVTLTSISGSVLGMNSTFNITILPSDDPYGLISFKSNYENINREVCENKIQSVPVSFLVMRNKGLFGKLQVTWIVYEVNNINNTMSAEKDILPVSGVLTIEEGKDSASITIFIQMDEEPEEDETFFVIIESVKGGATIKHPLQAVLKVPANDFPVTVTPSTINLIEGSNTNLSIHLSKMFSEAVYVGIKINFINASENDFSPIKKTITFLPFETEKSITLQAITDGVPELNETCIFFLASTTGDTVLYLNFSSEVTILENDDPYGVFCFSDINPIYTEEGKIVNIRVIRQMGLFKNVTVHWSTEKVSTDLFLELDLGNSSGTLFFENGQKENTISIFVIDDNIPELEESFIVQLLGVTGANAQLGMNKTLKVNIQNSDYPNGVFEINSNLSTSLLAEDKEDSPLNGQIIFERKYGSFFSAKIIWQVYATYNKQTTGYVAWDLLFHARNKKNVLKTQSVRMHSSTAAYYFKNGCVAINMTDCPFKNFDFGFSVGVWFKTNVSTHSMSLFKKTSIDGIVTMDISLDMSKFFLLLNKSEATKNKHNLEWVTEWHSFFISVKSTIFTMYLDGNVLINSSLPEVTLKLTDQISIGCGRLSPFDGFLQDFRLYQGFLDVWDIRAVHHIYPVISPSNGELFFDVGETKKVVYIQSVDDTMPEADQLYDVGIIDVNDDLVFKDKAIINSEKSKIAINVLKSDFANGIFLLDKATCNQVISEKSHGINITINRVHALFGNIEIEWNITSQNGSIANDDFLISNGTVAFMENENKKVIEITPYDDSLPELDETFFVNIRIHSVVDQPVKSFAMVNFSQCNITINKSDHPFGIFQIITPNINSAVLLSKPLNVSIKEEITFLSLYIVRVIGFEGSVYVEWRTRGFDGTNETSGLTAIPGVDFEESIGFIKMGVGENVANISVRLFDNEKPELTKLFLVELKNPFNAELGNGSVLFVHILPSDDALGIFSFPIVEYTTCEGSFLNISIKRSGGTLGNVKLGWILVNGSNEFSLSQGEVDFQYGVTERFILIQAVDDERPELTEVYLIQLLNVSGGSISSINQTASLKLLSSDYPYGLIEFEKKSIEIEEKITHNAFIQVNRSKGTFGHIRLYYNTIKGLNNQSSATMGEDFSLNGCYLDFVDGQKSAVINITIIDDNEPEMLETFLLNLTDVEIISENNTKRLNLENVFASTPNMITINILPNDNPNGILNFQYAKVHVSEDYNDTFLSVIRSEGLFGRVSFGYSIETISAEIGLDFSVSSFTMIIEENQSSIMLPIFTIFDELPEFNETFIVRLLPDTFLGGLVMGLLNTSEVTILENDFPYGKIGFSKLDDVIASEPEILESGITDQKVFIKVVREGGSYGYSQIRWVGYPTVPWFGDNDIAPLKGFVTFLTGETSQNIIINIMPDSIPEINETYIILLKEVSAGNAVINDVKSSLRLIILLNDNPYGTVKFMDSAVDVLEGESDYNVTLRVNRVNGMFGDLRVFWRTNHLISFKEKATPGADFGFIPNQFFVISNASSQSEIQVLIYSDEVPELDEMFQVELLGVEVVDDNVLVQDMHVIDDKKYVNITILENDEPYGMFALHGFGISKNNYSVFEPENTNLTLEFYISRKKGAFKRVSVSWQVNSTEISKDDICCNGEVIVFEQDERLKFFSISVLPDLIPENDEEFSVYLLNSTDGSIVDGNNSYIKVIILANDNFGGIIQFCNKSIVLSVKEGEKFSLCLQRSLPAFGDAVVTWKIIGDNVTQDFVSDQGFANFSTGQTITTINLESILDQAPETDEYFVVRLVAVKTAGVSISGAAVLDETYRESFLTIAESDFPNGIVEFANDIPLYVDEGKTLKILVIRQFGKIGKLNISYNVITALNNKTINQASVQSDLHKPNTMLTIPDGEDSGIISIEIVNDNIPELDEEFKVELMSVSISGTFKNSSSLLGVNKQKRIIITANDAPHGVLTFASTSLNLVVKEENTTFNLTVIRSFGLFGDVYCFYFLNYFTANSNDFYINGDVMNGGPVKLLFLDGQSEANITVYINDDNITENNEFFELGLTTQNAINNGGVETGVPSRTSITILANDDANGVFLFSSNSRNIVLSEPESFELIYYDFEVERLQGLFGKVILEWRAYNSTAINDISPISGVLQFEEYQRFGTFRVYVSPDDLPELEEVFLLELNVLYGDARLGVVSCALITILANDYPFGLFSFFSENTIYVDESQKTVKVAVVRNQGTFGNVTVEFTTESNTAVSETGNQPMLGVEFNFLIDNVLAFLSFNLAGKQLVLLSTQESTKLFEWRGTFVYILDLPLKNLSKMLTSIIDTETILLVKDHLSVQIYLLSKDFSLTHVQTMQDVGISDVLMFKINTILYLTITRNKDNEGESILWLQLYEWRNNIFFKLPFSGIQTFFGESMAFIYFNGDYYVAVANQFNRLSNSYNIKSYVYKWDIKNGYFVMYGEIQTYKAKEINFYEYEKNLFVTVVNDLGGCQLLKHDMKIHERFSLVQKFSRQCISLKYLHLKKHIFLVVVGSTSYLYKWNMNSYLFEFHMMLPISNLHLIESFYISNEMKNSTLPYLAVFSSNSSSVLRIEYLKNSSDFFFRSDRLYFMEGEKVLEFFLSIVDDEVPEFDEIFKVRLLNSSGGSSISSSSSINIVIMSNDNPFGRFKFTDSSLHQIIEELDIDSIFFVWVQREFGCNGVVNVRFDIVDTTNNRQDKVYPQYGNIKFFPGDSLKKINLYLKGDFVPELEKKILIRLTDIETINGTSNSKATINYNKNIASIIIPANDDPNGVFTWKSSTYVITKDNNVSSLLVLKRDKGAFGSVTILFETVIPLNVGPRERPARPFVDFIPIKSNVTFSEDQREAFVFVEVIHKLEERKINATLNDGLYDYNEVFFVNITEAYLTVDKHTSASILSSLTQVVITELIQQNGIIEFSSSLELLADENIGTLEVMVSRNAGFNGSVGVYFEVVFGTASNYDITPAYGTVSLGDNQKSGFILIKVENDNIPEFDENFTIVLTKPFGGAKIGAINNRSVIIKENDYPYGLFSLKKHDHNIEVEEGDKVMLLVFRAYGIIGDIKIKWKCNGTNTMISLQEGTIYFLEGETSKNISFVVIDDDIPELSQIVLCEITSVSDPAVLSNSSKIFFIIKASDKPYGIYIVNPLSRVHIGFEPSNGIGGKINISVLREIGQATLSTLSWKFNSSSQSKGKETFKETFGTLTFKKGEVEKIITLEILDDDIPEEAQMFELVLYNPTDGAELSTDLNSSISYVFVAASDNPYGLFAFANVQWNVEENVGVINIPVLRSAGLIGGVHIGYQLISLSAIHGEDYSPKSGVLFFQPHDTAEVIQITIYDDVIPELDEMFMVNLTYAELDHFINFNEVVLGYKLNIPPLITGCCQTFQINANDDPYGVLEFPVNKIVVRECDHVKIPVVRRAGLFTGSNLSFTYLPLNATENLDFFINSSILQFHENQNSSFIEVWLVDDDEPEDQEAFEIRLLSVVGFSKIGHQDKLLVVIESSDNPNGLFGFYNLQKTVYVQNPSQVTVLCFNLSRIDGIAGKVVVEWMVENVDQSPVLEDVSPDRGFVVFEDKQSGTKELKISILPHLDDHELEEQFVLRLVNISGGGKIQSTADSLIIVVKKKGYPNGLFSFIQTLMEVKEPTTGFNIVKIKVVRELGLTDVVEVSWSIVPVSNGSSFDDFTFNSSSLKFLNGESSKFIYINITSDHIPEINETFYLMLLSATNFGEIQKNASVLELVILENDDPFGVFKLSYVTLLIKSGERFIDLAVERNKGTFNEVKVFVLITFMNNTIFNAELYFQEGCSYLNQVIKFNNSLFFSNGSILSIEVINVVLITEKLTLTSPQINCTTSRRELSIPEIMSNSVVNIFPSFTLLSNGSVCVYLTRIGLFSSIVVNIKTSVFTNKYEFIDGLLKPSFQSITMPHGTKEVLVSFNVVVPDRITEPLNYKMFISNLQPKPNQLGWPTLGLHSESVIDPHGIVQVSRTCLEISVAEGGFIEIVIERILGAQGKVRVFYETKACILNPALPGIDFIEISSFIDLEDGEIIKKIPLSTIDDILFPLPEDRKCFQFLLISVHLITTSLTNSSPRLSFNNASTVFIEDNDFPYGFFSFTNSTFDVFESNIGFAEIEVKRLGGSFSDSKVEVVSIGGGESWSDEVLKSFANQSIDMNKESFKIKYRASAGSDYAVVKTTLVFPKTDLLNLNGQVQKVNVRIFEDYVSEPDEVFFLALSNATGGAQIMSHFITSVNIKASGLIGGEVGFKQKVAEIDEDGDQSLSLVISRFGESLENVTVSWMIYHPFDLKVLSQFKEKSGKIIIPAGKHEGLLRLSLIPDDHPETLNWALVNITGVSKGAFVRKLDSAVNITLLESDAPAGIVGFDIQSRYSAVDAKENYVTLIISRYNGTLKNISITYQTLVVNNAVKDAGIVFYPAVVGSDFQHINGNINMDIGQLSAKIIIKLSPEKALLTLYPKIFNVVLETATNGAILHKDYSNAVVVISTENAQFLKLRSTLFNLPMLDSQISLVLSSILKSLLSKVPSYEDQQVIKTTIEEILNFKNSEKQGYKRINKDSIGNLLQIFNILLDSRCSESKGRSFWVKNLENFAFHLLNDLPCSSSVFYKLSNYDLKAYRINSTILEGFVLKDGYSSLRYSNSEFSNNHELNCLNLQFLVLKNSHLFISDKNVLNNKIMSSSVISGLNPDQKVIFRVYTSKKRVTSVLAKCVIWEHAASGNGFWSPTHCRLVLQNKNFVECECDHMSEYAVLASSDNNTGFDIYFFVACFFTGGACFFALLGHHCCSIEKTFTSNLLMHMFFAVMTINILYAVGAYLSPTLFYDHEACSVLGAFLHYFFLAQFTTMFAQTCNLWRILVMNDEHSYRKFIIFFLIGWGFPFVIIICYVFITYAIWGWSFVKMYADVHIDGDMCFIPQAYAAFSVAVIPVLLLILASSIVFVQAYQLTPQWKSYDDVYRGRYNIKEVRHVMILFALISTTWLFGGLHLAYRYMWMIIAFTFFNVITGLYILFVYAIFRNQMRHITKGEYDVKQTEDNMELPNIIYRSPELKTNKFAQRDYLDLNEWDTVDLRPMTPVSTSASILKTRSVDPRVQLTPSSSRVRGVMNDIYFENEDNNSGDNDHDHNEYDDASDKLESAEFEDLIFALKSGRGYVSSQNEDSIEN